MLDRGYANFRERRTYELPRILLLRTRVNKVESYHYVANHYKAKVKLTVRTFLPSPLLAAPARKFDRLPGQHPQLPGLLEWLLE